MSTYLHLLVELFPFTQGLPEQVEHRLYAGA